MRGHSRLAGPSILRLGFFCCYGIFDFHIVELFGVEDLATLQALDKLGVVLLVLGCMHFFNLFVFSRIRKSKHADEPEFGGHQAGRR